MYKKYNLIVLNFIEVSNKIFIIHDKIIENKTDIIIIIEDDPYFQNKILKKTNGEQNIFVLPSHNKNSFFKLLLENMNIEFIKAKCYSSALSYIDDNITKNKEILNIDKMLHKIKTELGITIDKNKINDLFNVTISKDELKKIKSDICKNLEKLNELLEIKNYDNIYNSKHMMKRFHF